MEKMQNPHPHQPWQWWAGDNDETYAIGPYATRGEALEEAFGHFGIDPGEPPDAAQTVHVIEALKIPIELADHIDIAEYVSDRLEDGGSLAELQNEGCDAITADVTDAQWADLQARFKTLVAQWQTDHGIVLESWKFQATRNAEQVWPPHPMAAPLTEPEQAILETTLDEMYPATNAKAPTP